MTHFDPTAMDDIIPGTRRLLVQGGALQDGYSQYTQYNKLGYASYYDDGAGTVMHIKGGKYYGTARTFTFTGPVEFRIRQFEPPGGLPPCIAMEFKENDGDVSVLLTDRCEENFNNIGRVQEVLMSLGLEF